MKQFQALPRILLLANLLLLLSLGIQTFGQSAPASQCDEFTIDSIYLDGTAAAGDTIEFWVVSKVKDVTDRKFIWTTSLGEIVSGQGTSRIHVKTSKDLLSQLPAGKPFPTVRLKVATQFSNPPERKCEPVSMSIGIGRWAAIINRFANVTSLKLSTNSVVLPCAPGRHPSGTVISVIDVETTAHDPENDVLTYEYNVSGGVIKGRGPRVQWDLTGVEPGTYTITAGADDGCGVCGLTKTQIVTVALCTPSCSLIDCPSLGISGPDYVESGDSATFTANVSGGSQSAVTYNWVVANGEIMDGQGSPTISVKIPQGLGRGSVSVTVKIGGLDPAASCMDSVTKEFHESPTKP